MRKNFYVVFAVMLAFLAVYLIGSGDKSSAAEFTPTKGIDVVSREDGSGTRGAFISLFGIELKGKDGSRKDRTTKEAVIANQTSVMMTKVASSPYSIGYISLGSLNDTVKAVKIDGVAPTTENTAAGKYKVARPFIIATKGQPTGLAKDFIDFVLSRQGQIIVAKSYIAVSDKAAAKVSSRPAGRIVLAGSSSVTPVMEKLREAYLVINKQATIEIQESDSSAGMTAVIEGTCDIGMSSRALKESELNQLTPQHIATDGIAVIVNKENPLTNLTLEQVAAIYSGELTRWNEVIK